MDELLLYFEMDIPEGVILSSLLLLVNHYYNVWSYK